jgi:hypothetical protein
MARITFLKLWITRWTVWEYLPWWVANIPVYGIWLWFSLRARHLFFFSNVNPAIPLGGAMGESKSDILRLLPAAISPKWVLAAPGDAITSVQQRLDAAGIGYPLIAKPDVGERGFLVKKIAHQEALAQYLQAWPATFILQEFLDFPKEASVLFYVFPGEKGRFGITSVCLKAFLTVTGDGVSSVRTLMGQHIRAAFQLPRFEREFPNLLDKIPAAGESLLLEPIGNHARGTMFLNGNHLVTPDMEAAFEGICRNIKGVCYGRFDLKYHTEAELQRGVFKTMELNGVFGEPAHVYDPQYGARRAYRDVYRHWRLLYQLYWAQQKQGVAPTGYREAFRFIQEYFRYKKALESRTMP